MCYRPLLEEEEICSMCESSLNIMEAAEVGYLPNTIREIIFPFVCTICELRYADKLRLSDHTKCHIQGTSINNLIPKNMKLPELREELKQRNLSTVGSKQVLIERLESYI